MSIKISLFVGAMLVGSSAFAQVEPAAAPSTPPVVEPGAEPIRISDAEAVIIIRTIKGHVEGTFGRGFIKTFDRKKGEEVRLKLDRIVTDDPERIAFLDAGKVAVCGECSQVDKDDKESGDKYEVWFVVERGDMINCRVLEVVAKSVNGVPMYTWSKDATGKWVATLAPDPK